MFERYTEKARRTIFFARFARYEASQLGSSYIESEHLLIGLLREDKALATRLLPSHAALETIRKQVDAHAEVRERVSISVDIPLADDCKRVLAYAAEEASKLEHHFIGCEHLLLGLLREEHCFAAQLLTGAGLTLLRAREEIGQHPPSQTHSPKPHAQTLPFGLPVPALPVADLSVSVAFYTKLGFRDVYGQNTDPVRLLSGTTGFLALYDQSLGGSLMCFTGGDLSPILERVKSGDLHAEHPLGTEAGSYLLLRDPDGHRILLLSPDPRPL